MSSLIAIHNIEESKLNGVLELGGFAMPSIALCNSDYKFDNFGNISFLPKREAYDPKCNRKNRLYTADAYTARVPKLFYQFDVDKVRAALNITQEEMDDRRLYSELNSDALPNTWDVAKRLTHCLSRPDLTTSEVENIIMDCASAKGYQNDKDIFTPIGNRRSFKQLTIPYTLDNTIKMMNKGSGKEHIMATGTPSEWKGHICNTVTRIENIKGEELAVDEEANQSKYEEIKGKIWNLLNKLYPLQQYLDAPIPNTIVRCTPNMVTERIQQIFKNECNIDLPEDLANEIKTLAKEVAELPVTYIEAKPERAVYFNEMAAVIIPDDLNPTTKGNLESVCQENGIKIYEYDSVQNNRHAVLQKVLEENPELRIADIPEKNGKELSGEEREEQCSARPVSDWKPKQAAKIKNTMDIDH